jgi:hypothetical protein
MAAFGSRFTSGTSTETAVLQPQTGGLMQVGLRSLLDVRLCFYVCGVYFACMAQQVGTARWHSKLTQQVRVWHSKLAQQVGSKWAQQVGTASWHSKCVYGTASRPNGPFLAAQTLL